MGDTAGESGPEGIDAAQRELEVAAEEAILACGGDLRETVKALLVLTDHLERQLSQVSYGYARRSLVDRAAG